MNPSDKTLLLKLASSLPVGSPERKAILSGLTEKKASSLDDGSKVIESQGWEPLVGPALAKAQRILKHEGDSFIWAKKFGRKTVFLRNTGVIKMYAFDDEGNVHMGKFYSLTGLDKFAREVLARAYGQVTPSGELDPGSRYTMKAAARGSDAEILLGDIAMKAGLNGAAVRKISGGAELVGQDDYWVTYTIVLSDDGRYEIKAEGQVRGSIPYMPYEDHDEMADDLIRGDDHFSIFRRR
jgi:hypothetical protein